MKTIYTRTKQHVTLRNHNRSAALERSDYWGVVGGGVNSQLATGFLLVTSIYLGYVSLVVIFFDFLTHRLPTLFDNTENLWYIKQ